MGILPTSLLRPFARLVGLNSGPSPEEGLATMRSLTKQALRWRTYLYPALWAARREMPRTDIISTVPGDLLYASVARPTLSLMSSILTRGPLVSDKDGKYIVKGVDKKRPQFVRELGSALRPRMYFRRGISHMFGNEGGHSIYWLKGETSRDLVEFYMDRTFTGSMITLTMKDPGGLFNYMEGLPHVFSYINMDLEDGRFIVNFQRQMPPSLEVHRHFARRRAMSKLDADDPTLFNGEVMGRRE